MNSPPTPARHWQQNTRLSAALLLLWLAITLGVTLFAEPLNGIDFIGPLGFYMAAQGALVLYLLIIGIYAWAMRRLDQRHGLTDESP